MKIYFRFLLSLTAAFGVLLSTVAETVPEGLTDLTEPVQANVSTSVSTFFEGSGPFYAFDNNENDRVMSTGTDPFDVIYTFGQGTVVNAYTVQMVAANYRKDGSLSPTGTTRALRSGATNRWTSGRAIGLCFSDTLSSSRLTA